MLSIFRELEARQAWRRHGLGGLFGAGSSLHETSAELRDASAEAKVSNDKAAPQRRTRWASVGADRRGRRATGSVHVPRPGCARPPPLLHCAGRPSPSARQPPCSAHVPRRSLLLFPHPTPAFAPCSAPPQTAVRDLPCPSSALVRNDRSGTRWRSRLWRCVERSKGGALGRRPKAGDLSATQCRSRLCGTPKTEVTLSRQSYAHKQVLHLFMCHFGLTPCHQLPSPSISPAP